jgi:hypothetical protein
LPDVEFHLLDTGHFALEDKADEMVPRSAISLAERSLSNEETGGDLVSQRRCLHTDRQGDPEP